MLPLVVGVVKVYRDSALLHTLHENGRDPVCIQEWKVPSDFLVCE